MKKKFYSVVIIIFSLIILCCSPQKVFAINASISASTKKIEKGKSVTLTANVSSASSWDFDISASGGTLKKSNDRVGSTDSGNNENKTVNLGTFVSDQEGTYTIKLSGYVVDGDTLSKKNISDEVSITVSANTNSSDNQGNTGNTDTTPAAKSKEARLKTLSASTSSKVGLESLEIKDVELTPSFKTEVYNYQVELDKDVDSLDISAIPIEDDTSVEIAGNQDFKEGENVVTILVKNEKTEKTITYQITVNKNVTSEDQGTVEEFSWFKPSTWGREIIIKAVIAVVLVILIIIAVILKIKLSREKKGKNKIDLPGADELDKALAEHQELTELENTEDDNYYTVNNENQEQDQIQEQTIHQYDSESSQESNAYKFKNDYDGNYIEDIAKSKNYDIDDNDNNDYSYDYQDDNSRRTKRKGRGKHF